MLLVLLTMSYDLLSILVLHLEQANFHLDEIHHETVLTNRHFALDIPKEKPFGFFQKLTPSLLLQYCFLSVLANIQGMYFLHDHIFRAKNRTSIRNKADKINSFFQFSRDAVAMEGHNFGILKHESI